MMWKSCMFILLISVEFWLCTCNSEYITYNVTTEDYEQFRGVHEMLASCQAVMLDPDEYVLFSNGTAFVEAYKKTYNSSFYWLADGILNICAPSDEFQDNLEERGTVVRYHVFFYYMTRACLGVSIVCLLLHLVAFCLVPELRNLPGYCLVALCVSLLLFYILFFIADMELIESYRTACIVFATASYFLILSSFMWMATMGFDIFRSLLKATGKLRLSSKKFGVRRFVLYGIFSWGVPLLCVAAALTLDNIQDFPDSYRPLLGKAKCWFNGRKALLILFAGPVFAVLAANVIFFIASAYMIFSNRLQTSEVDYRTTVRKNFTLHYRLATIMGLTWIVGIANTSQNFTLLTIYVFLSSLQGFFIFLACSCTAKVRNNIRQRLHMRDRKVSTVTTTATFQTYCNEEFVMKPETLTIPMKDNDCST